MPEQIATVSLSDYSPVEQGLQDLCRDIQRQISAGSCRLVDLLDNGDEAAPLPEVFKDQDGVLRTQKYIGLFEYQGTQVVIGSRFDVSGPAGAPRPPFFLQYLMENFLGESMLFLEDVGGICGGDLFDGLLAAKLAVQLQRAWKKGRLRAYRTFRYNDSQVKGQLDVPRHIRENMGLKNGRIAYQTREYSLNNAWNILFLQAAAAARARHPALLRRLEEELPEFQAALQGLQRDIPNWSRPRQDWVLEHTRQKISNPIFRDYEGVRPTARSILRRMGADPFAAGHSQVVTGAFLDIDRLWERLLEERLFRGAPTPFAQLPQPVPDSWRTIRPDFFWKDLGVVLDAKNRPVWSRTLRQETWSEFVREDVHQVLGYMITLECKVCGVIFPMTGDAPRDPVPDLGRWFWRVPVLIPGADCYPDFRRALDQELDRLRTLDPIRRVLI